MDALEVAEVPGTAAQHMQPVGLFSLRDRIRCAGRGGCGDEVAVVRHGVLMQYRQIFIQSSRRVGYENPMYFSRAFRKAKGLSPMKYRKVFREKLLQEGQDGSLPEKD